MIELSEDGLSFKEKATKKQIEGTALEGKYIYKQNNYYYFSESIVTCCEGAKSTYQLVVGRSKLLFHNYIEKK